MSSSNEYMRDYRKRTSNAASKRYEKTKNGFLMRLYRNMKYRIKGIQKQKHHLYEDKFLLDKQDFYEWALNCPEFHIMFRKWEDSEYNRKLTPTVDRIDSNLGYKEPNIQWLTHSENSKKGKDSKDKKYKLGKYNE